jgi:SPP1 family predicted phage head-tail adaptor
VGISASELNRRIRIERQQGRDEAGQPQDAWVPVVTVWANIKGPTGLGAITRNQDNVAASIDAYSVRIRFREGLDVGMRVVILKNGLPTGKPLDIRQVRMDYAGRDWTDLVCEQGGTNG